MENKETKIIRKLRGVVVSDKMDKTIVVEVVRLKKDRILRKYYKVSTKYKAHDENNEYKTGDKVVIEPGVPMSKTKRWVVAGKI